MQVILFDTAVRNSLLPFTHTRPVADIRCGILTMRERWERFLNQPSSTLTVPYLQTVFPNQASTDNLYINGAVFANPSIADAVLKLNNGGVLAKGNLVIGYRTDKQSDSIDALPQAGNVQYDGDAYALQNVWDIFANNGNAILGDYKLLTYNKQSQPIPEHVTVTGRENLFIEEGAIINAGCIINASTGPVYIAKGSEILEGCMLRGPIAIGENAVVKMGAKIYSDTTIGAGCKVGGEVSNVVFFANSNKGHDGYLGNAVIGEWCNLGADTNCSNLKNNYDEIKIWDEHSNKSVKTGLTFCGLLMGDHSKCAINTMFNTGTVVGVSANIFGAGFPEKFVPSYCWGGSEGMTTYSFDRAMETATRMMARRSRMITDAERDMYRYIFDNTTAQRDLFAK
ncbi:glucose-1-phosphate thymidylyltransferase [Chitinophagaceae bacterium IBVUCB1]|nr:glucose-1-phosphate thymidylyltransferase [Chitinophagaceae bacterium IBVUCB1]